MIAADTNPFGPDIGPEVRSDDPMRWPHAEHQRENPRQGGDSVRVSEGTRTPDRLDHNQELYQLSYAHQGDLRIT